MLRFFLVNLETMVKKIICMLLVLFNQQFYAMAPDDDIPLIALPIKLPSQEVLKKRFQDNNLHKFANSRLIPFVVDQENVCALDMVIYVDKLLDWWPIEYRNHKKSVVGCLLQDYPAELQELRDRGCLD